MLGSSGVDYSQVLETAKMLAQIRSEGLQIAVVIGGGNIFRGINLANSGIKRSPADQMGMLATLINGIALKTALEEVGIKVQLMSALECPRVAASFQYDQALKALDEGEMILFVGGTGNPYFTTDTCAALRAAEMGVDVLVKATKVDGVYDKDPLKDPQAKKFDTLTWSDYIARHLKVMDLSAVTLCMNEKIPIFVCNMALLGKQPFAELLSNKQGTLIYESR